MIPGKDGRTHGPRRRSCCRPEAACRRSPAALHVPRHRRSRGARATRHGTVGTSPGGRTPRKCGSRMPWVARTPAGRNALRGSYHQQRGSTPRRSGGCHRTSSSCRAVCRAPPWCRCRRPPSSCGRNGMPGSRALRTCRMGRRGMSADTGGRTAVCGCNASRKVAVDHRTSYAYLPIERGKPRLPPTGSSWCCRKRSGRPRWQGFEGRGRSRLRDRSSRRCGNRTPAIGHKAPRRRNSPARRAAVIPSCRSGTSAARWRNILGRGPHGISACRCDGRTPAGGRRRCGRPSASGRRSAWRPDFPGRNDICQAHPRLCKAGMGQGGRAVCKGADRCAAAGTPHRNCVPCSAGWSLAPASGRNSRCTPEGCRHDGSGTQGIERRSRSWCCCRWTYGSTGGCT